MRHSKGGETTRTRFAYDALGRRIQKTVVSTTHGGVATVESTWFIWQGMRLAQELRSPRLYAGASASADAPMPEPAFADARNTLRTYVYDPEQAYAPLACVEHAGAAQAHALPGAGDAPAMPAPTDAIYYYHCDPIGLPMEVTDAQGALCWVGHYGAWGKLERQEGEFQQALRYPGQYADDEVGLHYNTYRYYDPVVGRFISQDPIGLAGGLNLYAYAPNPTGWSDPWGWALVPLNAPGYTAYGLLLPDTDTPYYVGHTKQPLLDRLAEHERTGRAPKGSGVRIQGLEPDVTYTQSKAYEQAYSELHKTKTGFPGNVIEPIDKGRTDKRGKTHYKNYRAAAKALKIKPTKKTGSCT